MKVVQPIIALVLLSLFGLRVFASPAAILPNNGQTKIQEQSLLEHASLLPSTFITFETNGFQTEKDLDSARTIFLHFQLSDITWPEKSSVYLREQLFSLNKADFLSPVNIAFPFTTFW